MNSRLYELLRKYEHRGVSLYWGDDELSIFSLDKDDLLRMDVSTDGLPEVFVYSTDALLNTEGLGGIVADDEEALYAEVERWFSGEAG